MNKIFEPVNCQGVEDQGSDNPLVKQSNCRTNNNTLKEPINGGKQIFFTVNPCDEYWKELIRESQLTRNARDEPADYEEMFRIKILRHYIKILRYLKSYHKMTGLEINIHFEKTNRLHVHGIISYVPETYYGYEYILNKLSKRSHREFGVPRYKRDICAKYQWCNESWNGMYLLKQNYLRPMSLK